MSRRTVQDLIARYILEPTLRDVYVEGAFDERVLRQVFAHAQCRRPSVSRIDLVEVSDTILAKYHMTRGEKGELIALACEIYSILGNITNFTGVIDADCDRLLEKMADNPLILATDFTCMDIYWLEEGALRRFFTSMGQDEWNKDTLTADIGPVAKQLFLVRATNQSLNLGVAIIPFRKYCTKTGCTLTLDLHRYREAILISSGAGSRMQQFDTELARLNNLLDGDAKNYTHGHDLTELIFIAYKDKLGTLGIKEARTMEALLAMMMPIENLLRYPLFQKLIERVC